MVNGEEYMEEEPVAARGLFSAAPRLKEFNDYSLFTIYYLLA